jgi:hypothetical protein
VKGGVEKLGVGEGIERRSRENWLEDFGEGYVADFYHSPFFVLDFEEGSVDPEDGIFF